MAHLIELINSHNNKIMLVNLDNVTDIFQYDSMKSKLTLTVRDPDGEPQTIDCLESISEIMCIAEATQPLHRVTVLLQNLIIEHGKYNHELLTSIPKIKPFE